MCDLGISASTDEPIRKENVENLNDTNTHERPSRRAKTAAIDKIVGVTMDEEEDK